MPPLPGIFSLSKIYRYIYLHVCMSLCAPCIVRCVPVEAREDAASPGTGVELLVMGVETERGPLREQ